MRRVVLISALLAGLAWTSNTSAHEAPERCRVNGLNLGVAVSDNLVRQGDTLRFTVAIGNANNVLGIACHITGASIGIRLPGNDGQFVPGSEPTVIRSDATFNNPFTFAQVASYDWVVKLDPARSFGQAQAVADGTLHLTAGDPDRARDTKEVSFVVTNPVLKIDKIGSIESGQAPQNVTYTFKVTNDSTTPVPMSDVVVTDDKCGNATRLAGDPDVGNDRYLSNGETWTYTCSMLHQAPGVYTNTASACAVSRVDNRPVCSPPDTWTVTLTPPPANPPANPPVNNPPAQAGVRPAGATQAPCDIASPTGLNVRARELTTIRVKVRNVDAGTEARITLPGGKVVKAKVNAAGTATFKVRPTKSGRATIRMAECGDVERFTVKPARRVQTPRVPRVTG